jgi:hypothetical protein
MRFVFSNYSNHKPFAIEGFTLEEKRAYEAQRGHRVDWQDLLGIPHGKVVTATTLRGLKTALTRAGANWYGHEDLVERIATYAGLKF